jgi:inosine/guanosine/xanthosine phosphorylase family protein
VDDTPRDDRKSWITALTAPSGGPYRSSCPEGPTLDQDRRDRIKAGLDREGRFGRFVCPGGRMADGPAAFRARLDLLEARVRRETSLVPTLGLVLGSGLGAVSDEVSDAVALPFTEMPGWPVPSAPGHRGRIILGSLRGLPVVCLQGRLHLYEGLTPAQVVEPALLMHRLGARTLLLTNASGGVNPAFAAGTLMAITDHVNLTGRTPLLGPNDDAMGPRFLDLTHAWDPALRQRLHAAAASVGVELEEGIYVGLLGPTFETPAEVRMLGILGADAVGMSTVMEAVAARWVGMRLCGVSLVTNAGAGLSPTPLTHEEVLEAAAEAGPRLARVIGAFAESLASDAA